MSELDSLDAETLCAWCQRESIKFRAGFQDYNTGYCLELWRRALHEKASSAWAVLQHCFEDQVRGWFYQHPMAHLALRYQPNDRYFVDQTFSRIWSANDTKPIEVKVLPKITTYAKQTLNTVVCGACRPRKKEVQLPPDPGSDELDDQPSAPPPQAPSAEDEFVRGLDAPELWERIASCLINERERLVIDLIVFSGWKPRRICQELPQDFPDVEEIYRILENFRDRYSRRFPEAVPAKRRGRRNSSNAP